MVIFIQGLETTAHRDLDFLRHINTLTYLLTYLLIYINDIQLFYGTEVNCSKVIKSIILNNGSMIIGHRTHRQHGLRVKVRGNYDPPSLI